MNIVSWNVRGLGRPVKRFLVKDFLNLHFADVCYLQESKLEDFPLGLWREVGGPRIDQYTFLPARGSAGSIVIGWNGSALSGHLVHAGEFCLMVDFCYLKDNFRWRCTSVYRPNSRSHKRSFWEEIRACEDRSNAP